MRHLSSGLIAAIVLAAAPAAFAKEGCAHTWGRGGYKSFRQVEKEVHEKRGKVKILRIALCSAGAVQYFQVTIMDPAGTVNNVEVPAAPSERKP